MAFNEFQRGERENKVQQHHTGRIESLNNVHNLLATISWPPFYHLIFYDLYYFLNFYFIKSITRIEHN